MATYSNLSTAEPSRHSVISIRICTNIYIYIYTYIYIHMYISSCLLMCDDFCVSFLCLLIHQLMCVYSHFFVYIYPCILVPPAQAADITGLLSYLRPFGIVPLPPSPLRFLPPLSLLRSIPPFRPKAFSPSDVSLFLPKMFSPSPC